MSQCFNAVQNKLKYFKQIYLIQRWNPNKYNHSELEWTNGASSSGAAFFFGVGDTLQLSKQSTCIVNQLLIVYCSCALCAMCLCKRFLTNVLGESKVLQYSGNARYNSVAKDALAEVVKLTNLKLALKLYECYSLDLLQWLATRPRNPRF